MNYLVLTAIMLYVGLVLKLLFEGMEWRGLVAWKMVASTAFIIAGLVSGATETTYGRIVLVGLACCWIGDVLLEYDAMFIPGLVTFLLGHVAFICAFGTLGPRPLWMAVAGAAAVVVAIAVASWLHPHVQAEMRIPVYAYMLVISTMVVLAAGVVGTGKTPVLLAGAICFYISDMFVARRKFVTHSVRDTIYGNPLYFTGVWLIAITPGLL